MFYDAAGVAYHEFSLCQALIWLHMTTTPHRRGEITYDDTDEWLQRIGLFETIACLSATFRDHQAQISDEYCRRENPDRFTIRFWRNKPLIHHPRATGFIVIDPLLVAELMCFGPAFMLTAKIGDAAIAALGYAFEGYVRRVVSEAIPSGSLAPRVLFNQAVDVESRQIAEVDVIVTYGDSAIIIESKLAFIREDSIIGGDVSAYMEQVDRKFVQSERGNPKGLLQLANVVRCISDRTWLGPDGELENCRRILPVIITNDPLLSDGILCNYFGLKFQNELGYMDKTCVGQFHSGNLTIENIIVLTVDELELIEPLIGNRSFFDLLAGYSSSNPERLSPVYDHLIQSGIQVVRNQRMVKMAKSTLDEIAGRLRHGGSAT